MDTELQQGLLLRTAALVLARCRASIPPHAVLVTGGAPLGVLRLLIQLAARIPELGPPSP
jgi:hypothetical protein